MKKKKNSNVCAGWFIANSDTQSLCCECRGCTLYEDDTSFWKSESVFAFIRFELRYTWIQYIHEILVLSLHPYLWPLCKQCLTKIDPSKPQISTTFSITCLGWLCIYTQKNRLIVYPPIWTSIVPNLELQYHSSPMLIKTHALALVYILQCKHKYTYMNVRIYRIWAYYGTTCAES